MTSFIKCLMLLVFLFEIANAGFDSGQQQNADLQQKADLRCGRKNDFCMFISVNFSMCCRGFSCAYTHVVKPGEPFLHGKCVAGQ